MGWVSEISINRGSTVFHFFYQFIREFDFFSSSYLIELLSTMSNVDTSNIVGDNLEMRQLSKRKRTGKDKFESVIEAMSEISNRKIDAILKIKEDNGVPAELRDFFKSVSGSVAKFSAYDQAIVKKKIIDLITEIEIKSLES